MFDVYPKQLGLPESCDLGCIWTKAHHVSVYYIQVVSILEEEIGLNYLCKL